MPTLILYISLAHPELHSHELCLYDCLILIYIYTCCVYKICMWLDHPDVHLHVFCILAWLTQIYTHTYFVYELGSPRVIYTRDFMLPVHPLKVTSTHVLYICLVLPILHQQMLRIYIRFFIHNLTVYNKVLPHRSATFT